MIRKDGQTVRKPSKVVPGQSIRIPDLMRRIANNQELPNIGKNGQYDHPEDLEKGIMNPMNSRSFDFVDAKNLADDLTNKFEAHNKKVAKLKSEEAKKKQEKEFADQVQLKVKEILEAKKDSKE